MSSSIKAILLSLLIALSSAGPVIADCPVGDLNDDCQVDWKDLLLFTEDWLDQSGTGSKANLDGFNSVDMTDFALLADNWWAMGQWTGALQVTIYPQQAVIDGAKWRVDESPWRDSDYIETSLTVGLHKVEFKDIDGWDEPDYKMVEIYDGQTTTTSGEYRKPLVISEFMAVNDNIFLRHAYT